MHVILKSEAESKVLPKADWERCSPFGVNGHVNGKMGYRRWVGGIRNSLPAQKDFFSLDYIYPCLYALVDQIILCYEYLPPPNSLIFFGLVYSILE